MEARFKEAGRSHKLAHIALTNDAGTDDATRKYDEQIAELAKQSDELVVNDNSHNDQLGELHQELQDYYAQNERVWEEYYGNAWWIDDKKDNNDTKGNQGSRGKITGRTPRQKEDRNIRWTAWRRRLRRQPR